MPFPDTWKDSIILTESKLLKKAVGWKKSWFFSSQETFGHHSDSRRVLGIVYFGYTCILLKTVIGYKGVIIKYTCLHFTRVNVHLLFLINKFPKVNHKPLQTLTPPSCWMGVLVGFYRFQCGAFVNIVFSTYHLTQNTFTIKSRYRSRDTGV